jgi:beta-aspartyl-peptidase (threonine type)
MAPQLPLPTKLRRTLAVLGAWCVLGTAGAAAPKAPTPLPRLPPLERFVVGDINTPTPDPVQPGLLLIGGGEHDPDAMTWFLERAGHGHIVVLRASMTTDVADEIYRRFHGAVSVETFVFHDRKAALDPTMLQRLASADGVFIAGGDQSRYVKYWKHTPVARLLDAHVAAGKPLAGTSAGLAIMGEYLFSALTPARVTSDLALDNPTGRDITIESDFLHFGVMKGYLTDSHFDKRLRLGRLIAFMIRADSIAARIGGDVEGLGVDEATALAVLPNGDAKVYSRDPELGTTWVHDVSGTARKGKPLDTGTLLVTQLGVQSSFNLLTHEARQPRVEKIVRIIDGQIHPR